MRCSPTSESPSPSSSASSSRLGRPARRVDPLARRHREPGAAVPRRSRARKAADTSTRSATAGSATSGRSSSRSCCSRWAALFALYEGIEKMRHPHEVDEPRRGRRHPRCSPSCWRRSRCARRTRRRSTDKPKAMSWWSWIRSGEGARAAGRAARGHRGRDRPHARPRRRAAGPLHRRTALGRRRLDRHRRAPGRRSPSSSPSR